MKTTRGKHRALSDAQVKQILTRYQRTEVWQKRRAQVPTLRDFARANRLNERTVSRMLPKLDQKIELLTRIRDWGRAYRELREARGQIETFRGLAREFGVADGTIARVIRCNGEYKQVSPELIAETRIQRRINLERLRRLNLC